ncbi:MAG: glycosyltransferase [Taibaiella sp.]|nr:glycosyltransferase [Taibaiella sp.]
MVSVSVVIPVKNGLGTIKRCLDGILAQTVDVKEIVVVDSGSTDGTIALLKTYDKVELIEIAPADFNHGETRNIGVRNAIGDVVVLTVQDAWPAN